MNERKKGEKIKLICVFCDTELIALSNEIYKCACREVYIEKAVRDKTVKFENLQESKEYKIKIHTFPECQHEMQLFYFDESEIDYSKLYCRECVKLKTRIEELEKIIDELRWKIHNYKKYLFDKNDIIERLFSVEELKEQLKTKEEEYFSLTGEFLA